MSEVSDSQSVYHPQLSKNDQPNADISQSSDSEPGGRTPVQVGAGAAAMGAGSIAAGEGGVAVQGDVGGVVITGDRNVVLGFAADGVQNQMIMASLQDFVNQALTTVMRPRVEDLFHVVRKPAAVPAQIYGPVFDHVPIRPYDIAYEPAVRQDTTDTQALLSEKLRDALLVQSRGGLGKTREVATLAQESCAAGWTVCIARLENCRKMGEPADILPDKKILFVIDDLHRHMAKRTAKQAPYLDRLSTCLRLFADDPEVEMLVLGTAPMGFELDVEKDAGATHRLWQRFEAVELPEFTPAGLEDILRTAARRAGITIEETQTASLVADSDGTPKTIVENVIRALREGTGLTRDNWQNTWEGTWENNFKDLRRRQPLIDNVYEALHLVQSAGLPPRLTYVVQLGTDRARTSVRTAADDLIRRGLLTRRDDVLYPFFADQLDENIRAVGKSLPDLDANWDAVIQAVTAASEGQKAWTDDLVALADTLCDYDRFVKAEAVATTALRRAPDTAGAYFQRGFARLRLNNYRDADADFSAAIDCGRSDTAVFAMRAYCRLFLADYRGADSDFSQAIALDATWAYKGRGVARFMQAQFARAEDDFTSAIEHEPDDGVIFLVRALVRHIQDEYTGAVDDLTTAIDLGQSNSNAFFVRGWVHTKNTQWAAAESDFSEALRQDDSTAFVYLLRAWVRRQQGNREGAEADASAAIDRWQDDVFTSAFLKAAEALQEDGFEEFAERLAQDDVWLQQIMSVWSDDVSDKDSDTRALGIFLRDWMRVSFDRLLSGQTDISDLKQANAAPFLVRGGVRLELARFSDAEADFVEAKSRGADEAIVYYGLGLAKLGQNKQDEAESYLSTAIDSGQDDVHSRYWRGRLRLERGDHEGAETDLTKAIQHGRDDSLVYQLRSVSRVRQGGDKLSPAEADLSAAIDRSPADPDGYFLRGAVRFDLAQYESAEADFDAAEACGHQKTNLYALRGWSRFRQGNWLGAAADFELAIAREHQDPIVFHGRGATRFMLGEYNAAEMDYTRAIEGGPDNAELYTERGVVRVVLGEYAQAEADANTAIQGGADDGRAHGVRGMARMRQGYAADAVDDLNISIARGSMDPDVYYARAAAHLSLGNYAQADSDYTVAIESGMDEAGVYSERGWARFRLGNYALAEADLDTAIQRGENNAEVFYRRGRARYEQGNHAAAADDFQAAIECESGHGAIFAGSGEFLYDGDRLEAAEAAFNAAIARGYEDASVYSRRGLTRARLEDYSGADEDLTQAIARGHDDAAIYAVRGVTRYLQGQYADAEVDLTAAITQNADLTYAYQIRAAALIRLGQLDSARQDCEQARRMAPDESPTHDCWGDWHLASGAYDEAIAEYQTSLNMNETAAGYFELGLACLLAGRFEESVDAYDKGLPAAQPNDVKHGLRELDLWTELQSARMVQAEAKTTLDIVRQKLEQATARDVEP